MKFKALRTKTEPKEFIEIVNLGGVNMLFTCALPNPLPMTCTMEGLKEYHETQSPLPKEINLDDFELVEFDFIESGVVGADIRNKLSPLKNLVAMVSLISDGTFDIEDKKMIRMIKGDVDKCKKNIKYIANLL